MRVLASAPCTYSAAPCENWHEPGRPPAPGVLRGERSPGVLQYIPIGIQIVLAMALTGVILGLSAWLGSKRGSRTDLSPYECGMDPIDPSDKRFTIRFYMVAMLFILFDIEAAFMYPWATVFRDLGMEGFIGIVIFLSVLTVGFVYCWRRGALDWD